MSRTQNEAAFLGAVVVNVAYLAVEERMKSYAFATARFADVWTAIGVATRFNRFRIFDDGVLAVAAYVRQKHGDADALRQCLDAYEAATAGTTVEDLAARLLSGEDAA
jgi:hypothetical protein